MSRVSTIDATGAHVLADAVERLERRGVRVLLSGVAERHRDVLHGIGSERIFPDAPAALEAARGLVLAAAAA
jgi:SulP family sulfate permease